jgi:hypothetical protein
MPVHFSRCNCSRLDSEHRRREVDTVQASRPAHRFLFHAVRGEVARNGGPDFSAVDGLPFRWHLALPGSSCNAIPEP